jgi:hypothetical protein
MKKLMLLTLISLGIFALAGCGNTAEKANTEAPKNANTVANQNKEPEKKETAKAVFKPVEISPDAVKVNEFVDKVVANQNAWKGKEVTATGYVSMVSPKGNEDGYNLQLRNDEKGGSDAKVIGCSVQKGGVPEGIVMKAVEVKGTVSEVSIGDISKAVRLDPCTLKQ